MQKVSLILISNRSQKNVKVECFFQFKIERITGVHFSLRRGKVYNVRDILVNKK